jgi:hypothetical protein
VKSLNYQNQYSVICKCTGGTPRVYAVSGMEDIAKNKGTGLEKVCGITFPYCYQKNLGLLL